MPTHYSKNMIWSKNFIEYVKDIVPIERLKSVKGFRVPPHKQERVCAQLTRHHNNKSFTLTINLYEQAFVKINKNTRKFKGYHYQFLAELLDSLAHELAHLKQWEHEPEHMMLQARILMRFGRLLKKQGIKDTYGRVNPELQNYK